MSTRSPQFWPFLNTSIWNQPIGTSATYTPAYLAPRPNQAIGAEKVPLNMDYTQTSVTVYKNKGQHDSNRCTGSDGPFSPAISLPYAQSLLIPSSNDNYPGAFTGPSP